MDSQKWKLGKIKSVRVSNELLEMLEKEIAARKTTLSKYLCHAMILQMKWGNQPKQDAA
jgi:hypothetical protein